MRKAQSYLFAALTAILLLSFIGLLTENLAIAKEPSPRWHRAYFQVEGASCAVCLKRIGESLSKTKGVHDADISIYRPYNGIVTYNAALVSWTQLSNPFVKNEGVKFVNLQDTTIDSPAAPITPKWVMQTKSTKAQKL